MMTDDETGRFQEAFGAAPREDALPADCPAPQDIWAAVGNELGPREFRRVLAHVAGCSVCTEAWRLAQALEEPSPEKSSAAEPSLYWRKAVGVLAAASVVLVVGVVARQVWQTSVPEPISRTARGTSLELLGAEAPLPHNACVLRWTAFEEAHYDVIVSTQDLDILSKAEGLTDPEYTVPRAHLAGASPDEPLMVYIEAHRLGDGTVASGTFTFEVRGESE